MSDWDVYYACAKVRRTRVGQQTDSTDEVCLEPGTGEKLQHCCSMNAVERVARRIDVWQQWHPVVAFPVAVAKKFGDDQAGNLVWLLVYYGFVATFPLLLALTALAGVALRRYPQLQHKLISSAFAEFPNVGSQIHHQLGRS